MVNKPQNTQYPEPTIIATDQSPIFKKCQTIKPAPVTSTPINPRRSSEQSGRLPTWTRRPTSNPCQNIKREWLGIFGKIIIILIQIFLLIIITTYSMKISKCEFSKSNNTTTQTNVYINKTANNNRTKRSLLFLIPFLKLYEELRPKKTTRPKLLSEKTNNEPPFKQSLTNDSHRLEADMSKTWQSEINNPNYKFDHSIYEKRKWPFSTPYKEFREKLDKDYPRPWMHLTKQHFDD